MKKKLALPEKPNDEFLAKLYKKVEIAAETYTWQTEPVETLGVKSFLFTTAEKKLRSRNSHSKIHPRKFSLVSRKWRSRLEKSKPRRFISNK